MKNIILLLFGFLITVSVFSQTNRFSSLYLTQKPTVLDTGAQVLVRDNATGLTKFRHANTFGGTYTASQGISLSGSDFQWGGAITTFIVMNQNFRNAITYSGSFTATNTNQYFQSFGGTTTGRAGQAADNLFGYRFLPTLITGTSGQTLTGVEIKPGFSGSGTFYSLAVRGNSSDLLTVTNTGAVAIPALTTDRIPYIGASGVLTNGPYWDNTNTRLGIGAAPAVNLDVVGSTGNVRGRFLNSGSGDVELNLRRTGGTASDWSIYSPSGQSFLSIYNAGEKFRFLTTGVFQILTTPTNDNTNTNILTWDGANVETRAVSSLPLTAAGSNTQFQYNNSGVLGASSTARFESGTGTSLFGNTSTYSVTNETMQITKGHTTYSGIEDVLSVYAHGTTFGSVTNGFGGRIKLGIAGTAGTVGRTGVFEHSWTTVNSASKVRVGQVVGANPAAVLDFKSDGSFDLYNNATNTLAIDPNGHISAPNGPLYLFGQSGAGIIVQDHVEITPTAGNTIKMNRGVYGDGSGLKHARVTTGSINALTETGVTVTWSSAFLDTNYTVTASVVEAGGDLVVLDILSQTASTVTVYIRNNDTTTAATGVINVIAMHD